MIFFTVFLLPFPRKLVLVTKINKITLNAVSTLKKITVQEYFYYKTKHFISYDYSDFLISAEYPK